ncbi:MAG TPA: inorganic diphosphatase [Candidatus Dormibacteraeota bacterium]|nr:inorganic diphosphatase [Candidatus Dormibacteraeota bacterium]
MRFEVVVEVPKGSRNKYEIDHRTGVVHLDRQLFTATRYPADYGYVEGTLGDDGDPLDALVFLEDPTFPGCHVEVRAVGVLNTHDEKGGDPKLLTVPAHDPRVTWNDIGDVPEYVLQEIRHFFDIYKELEPGKGTVVEHWDGRAAAEAMVRAGMERAATQR